MTQNIMIVMLSLRFIATQLFILKLGTVPERIEAFDTYLKVLEECFPSKSKNPSQG